jgi:predicted DNA-binding transcriptional regulator AlpA
VQLIAQTKNQLARKQGKYGGVHLIARVQMTNLEKNNVVATFPEKQLEEMVAMVFVDQQSDQSIAEHFNMSKPTFYKLKRTERFQKALKLHGEVAVRFASAKIQAHSEKAVATLVRLMAEGNEASQLKAATELLRLSGLNQPLPKLTMQINTEDHRTLVLQHLAKLTPTTSKEGKVNE